MALKLMYITNRPEIARIAESAGVDRIFVDLEYIGKDVRQGGLDTVQSHHTLKDIVDIKKVITTSELLVRCNPIHDKGDEYSSSEEEIEAVIKDGADIVMLPYFKTVAEVKRFIDCVGGRVRTMLLVETPEAVSVIDDILEINGIDEVFIGLNDLSLGYGKKFMFELLADGTVESLCNKFRARGLSYGFGGIASLGHGTLPSELIIKEHYRLHSSEVILSRSFCDVSHIDDLDKVKTVFVNGVREIRDFEKQCEKDAVSFAENHKQVVKKVKEILEF